MFKHFFAGVAVALTANAATAAETIDILWAFNIGSNQANTVRYIIDEANSQQNKYKFILINKPGAGGTIAANHVLQNPDNTLVAMSSSFFIRSVSNPKNSHDLDKFQTILVQATGAPLVLVSKKYQSLSEVMQQKNATIGVSGVGSISDMIATQLKGSNSTLNVVQFKGMVDATVAAAGGHVDTAVTYAVDAQPFIDSGDLKIIAYTGNKDILSYKNMTFEAQGVKGLDNLTANYAIFSSKELSESKAKELYSILYKANSTIKVAASYDRDLLTPVKIDYDKSQDWYDSQREYWQGLADKTIK